MGKSIWRSLLKGWNSWRMEQLQINLHFYSASTTWMVNMLYVKLSDELLKVTLYTTFRKWWKSTNLNNLSMDISICCNIWWTMTEIRKFEHSTLNFKLKFANNFHIFTTSNKQLICNKMSNICWKIYSCRLLLLT